jgi:CBS domain-containing protein
MLAKLASINVWLGLFNLIPAFPMDGGRVLRALLATTMNYARATQVAAWIGQALAFVFGFLGLFYNPMLVFIAFFIYLGAQQEAAMAGMRDIALNLRVSDAMVTELVRLPERATIEEAIDALLRTSQHEFPVLDSAEHVIGVLTRNNIIAALKQHGATAPVAGVMHRELPLLHVDDPFEEAFRAIQQSGCPALPVADRTGRFAGLFTAENVGELMLVHSVQPRNGAPAWRATPSHG